MNITESSSQSEKFRLAAPSTKRKTLMQSNPSGNPNMTETSAFIQEKKARMEMAQQAFTQFPDRFPFGIRENILMGKVVVGMDTYQAYLAAGLFSYSVKADEYKWPPHTDPMKVIWDQPLHPDNSQIELTFQNDTQFPEEGSQSFRASFSRGTVIEIDRVPLASTLGARK